MHSVLGLQEAQVSSGNLIGQTTAMTLVYTDSQGIIQYETSQIMLVIIHAVFYINQSPITAQTSSHQYLYPPL